MKRAIQIFLCISFFSLSSGIKAQINVDAGKTPSAVKIVTNQTPNAVVKHDTTVFKHIDTSYIKPAECPLYCGKEPNGYDWLIIFTPITLFAFVLFSMRMVTRGKFNLGDALTENELRSKVEINPILKPENADVLKMLLANQTATNSAAVLAAMNPTVEVSDTTCAPSSSRYAAMLTVFFSLATAACFLTYYMYSFIKCPNKPVDLGILKDTFLALLVGIAPYGFNRLANGIQSKS